MIQESAFYQEKGFQLKKTTTEFTSKYETSAIFQ